MEPKCIPVVATLILRHLPRNLESYSLLAPKVANRAGKTIERIRHAGRGWQPTIINHAITLKVYAPRRRGIVELTYCCSILNAITSYIWKSRKAVLESRVCFSSACLLPCDGFWLCASVPETTCAASWVTFVLLVMGGSPCMYLLVAFAAWLSLP